MVGMKIMMLILGAASKQIMILQSQSSFYHLLCISNLLAWRSNRCEISFTILYSWRPNERVFQNKTPGDNALEKKVRTNDVCTALHQTIMKSIAKLVKFQISKYRIITQPIFSHLKNAGNLNVKWPENNDKNVLFTNVFSLAFIIVCHLLLKWSHDKHQGLQAPRWKRMIHHWGKPIYKCYLYFQWFLTSTPSKSCFKWASSIYECSSVISGITVMDESNTLKWGQLRHLA